MAMPEEITTPNEEKHPISWTGFFVWPFLLLLLYILSAGPIVMLVEGGHIPLGNRLVTKLYSPLDWAYWSTPLHKPLGMYLHLWAPKRFETDGEPAIPPGAVRFTPTNATTSKQIHGK